MLVPLQPSGNKSPLFFVHGQDGVMSLGPTLVPVLGSDQPLYAIHARGIDGRQPVIDNMRDMVLAYVAEIEEIRATGPVRVGGLRDGALAAIEMARELQDRGRNVGPVILAAPSSLPPGYVRENQAIDPRQPLVAGQLYQKVRRALSGEAAYPYNQMPFNPGNPEQLHAATLAGVGATIALVKHVSTPFSSAAELIVSARRALGFFHPQMPWTKLLTGPRIVHVLPWDNHEMFRSGRETLARLIQLLLDEASTLERLADGDLELSEA